MDLAPDARVRGVNDRQVRTDGGFVLYWMIATRRAAFNYALDRAAGWAERLGRPLVVLEALRADYPWASDRLHRFVIDGMRDNAADFASGPAFYYPYVEPAIGASRGLIAHLAASACIVVTDDFPCFFLPRMVAAAGRKLSVRLEAVDSNGLLPIRATTRTFTAAAHFRRFVQHELRLHLTRYPHERPLETRRLAALAGLPAGTETLWPRADPRLLGGDAASLAALPVDHRVPVAAMRGGRTAGLAALHRFVSTRLEGYHQSRNQPDEDATSRLSPYLHFGHISPHEIFNAVMRRERWSTSRLGHHATGAREGWWGVSPSAESYLDQLVVWRELAYNMCATRPDDYDRFESLPDWARRTLAIHVRDERPHVYTLAQFENAETHDALWNAAQRQMREEGWFHNYLRMLWGKKILEWSATPQDALSVMRSIMDRWSLDGRNPNSYAGYFWTLGRYDRPWPERPIYGTVRSMSSENTKRKVAVKRYIVRYGGEPAGGPEQATLLPR